MPGCVVVINGPGSAGKSTLVRAVQPLLPRPFLAFGLDLFLFGDVLPRDRSGRVRDWSGLRPVVLDGHRRAVRALADAGADVLVDVVVEDREQSDALDDALAGLDVFWVGLHAPAEEIERRERARGDRTLGEGVRDLATVHAVHGYDVELDSTLGVDACARQLVEAWVGRQT